MAQQFGHVFKPLQLKHGATLRNRIVMGTCIARLFVYRACLNSPRNVDSLVEGAAVR